MTGMERFVFDGKDVGFNFLDFWRFKYSNIYSLHGAIAEFIVSKALGLNQSQNSAYWALWDTTYREKKIEIKATAYYHLWNANGNVSKQRTFGITMAHGFMMSKKAGTRIFVAKMTYMFFL